MTLLDALTDPVLFAPWFTPEASWQAWRAFLAALFGLPMSEDQAARYRAHTGRQTLPQAPVREAWLVGGRRAGKSRVAALVAVFLACFRDYRPLLAPGERATLMVIAADRRQARVVFRYILGLLEGVALLHPLIQQRTREAVHLTSRVTIEVHTASFRAVRGYTLVGAVCDEVAYWRNEDSANPDVEIINALRPGMATVPEALLLCISSPYARRGALWEAYRHHYGQDGDPTLVWQADTRTMNPTVDESVIREAAEQNPAAAAAEYGAQFRTDVESFVTYEALQACVIPDRLALPPVSGMEYVGFVDPSGGSQDSMTLAIAHAEAPTEASTEPSPALHDRLVLDAVLERRPPFSPEAVVVECVGLLRSYGCTTVDGDRYAGEWPREVFRRFGCEYRVCETAKSDLYRELLPVLTSGRAELLDDPRLLAQLAGLERRTARGGRDSIDHAPGAHDDVANAAAGALVLATRAAALPPFAFV